MKQLTASLGAVMTMSLTAAATTSGIDARALSIAGYWTLNADLSDTALAARSDTDAQLERHWTRQILSERLRAPLLRHDVNRQALLESLLEPAAQLTVAPADGHQITIVGASGIWRTFSTSGRAELIDYGTGLVETATRWEERWLRQDITVAPDVTLIKRYLAAPESDALIVTISLNAASAAQGRPLMHVYHSDRIK
jgi:hypothetical protein